MKILDKIKALNAKGFTNYRIAKDTGISKMTIGRWVNGKAKPNKIYSDIIEKYAKEKWAI